MKVKLENWKLLKTSIIKFGSKKKLFLINFSKKSQNKILTNSIQCLKY